MPPLSLQSPWTMLAGSGEAGAGCASAHQGQGEHGVAWAGAGDGARQQSWA